MVCSAKKERKVSKQMKKLMIAVAAIAMAVSAQAVAVNWNSGMFMAPNADGSLQGISWNGTMWKFDSTKAITTAGAVQAFVWESTADLTFKSGDLYKWYADGKQGTPFEGITALTAASASGAANVASKINWNSKDPAYAAILYVLTDASGNVWYQENDVSVTVGNSATSLQFISDFVGGGAVNKADQTVNSWTAVPEPTSGLLLLLGVAGLALRRRRA